MAIFNIIKKESIIECPYCNEILKEPPKTKKKCPSCKMPVYFKVTPYTNEKYYLTEQKAKKMEELQDRYRIEERFYNRFKEYGLKEKHFKKRREEYDKKAKGNYSAFAFLNSIFNELILGHSMKNDFYTVRNIYYTMAYFLYEFNVDRGHNHNIFHYLYESKKMELYNYKSQEKQSGHKMKVQIMTFGKGYACNKCHEHEGKKFTIDEALEKMPIPVKDCEKGFCYCSYLEILEE